MGVDCLFHVSVSALTHSAHPRVVLLGCLEQCDSFSYMKRHLVNQFEMGFHGDSRKREVTVGRGLLYALSSRIWEVAV